MAAAAITLVEGLLTLGFGIAELFSLSSERLVMGLTTALLFIVFGVGLAGCAWGLSRVRTWARGPVLLTQVICIGLAWNFRGGDTTWVAVGLLALGVVALAGLLHPRSVEALSEAADGPS